MIKNSVFAVIITYNPDEVLEENILSLLNQTEHVTIIDNKSEAAAVEWILNLKNKYGFELILNSGNEGISTALNKALSLAANYDFFLTLDQDSVLSNDCVKIMLAELEQYNLTSIGPSYNTTFLDKPPKAINFLITSGNLIKTQAAINAGGFDGWMFIDGVDIDFSLKLRALGYKIAKSNKAIMAHSIGTTEIVRFAFFKIPITVHSLQRYYYMARNNLYLRRKHKKVFPFYCFKLKISFSLFKLKIYFLYKDKNSIFALMKRGRKDARSCKIN